MKHLYLLFFTIALSLLVNSQPWIENLPEEKKISGDLTFYEIQNAFNDYWEPFKVKNGYYEKNGEQIKAPYWKQFKRWEWYWENRVDPSTGKFPKSSAWEELQKFQKENPELKSSSGNWTNMGPSTTTGGYAGLGRLNCVAFVPNDANTLYVGAASGGIWKTTNGGSSWTPLGDNNPILGVSDIIVYRPVVGADILYIATGDRDGGSMWSLGGGQYNDNNSVGVLKSTDGGATWNTTGLTFTASQQRTVNRMLMDPSDINTLYAATSVGLYKTSNAGTSWTQLVSTHFVDIKFNTANSAIIYGSTYGGDIYRSTNSGLNWSSVQTTSYGRTELAVTANNSSIVYAVMESGGGLAGVYKSTNSGASFTQIFSGGTTNLLNWDCSSSATGGQGSYDLCIAADPTNANNVFVGGVNTWRSSNGGTSWVLSNHWTSSWGCGVTEVHADKHFLAYQNGTSTLFECNDGGLYKTVNNGSSWTHHGNGLVTSQIYRLGSAQTSSNDVITGLQDNGTKALLSGSWSDELGGDGFECAYDYTNHNIMYGELYNGDIRRSTNHGGSWTSISSGLTGSAHWCTPFVLDANTSTTLYIGYQDVWRSTNQGTSWTKISTWAGSTIRSLAVTANNSNVICAATQTTLYRTINGGTSWSNITGTLPTGSAYITYVWIKDTDPNTIWVSMGGYNSYGIYETTNGGTSWTNISTGLPSIPVMCVIQNKQNTTQNELYAGTDVGVYVKIGSSPWVPFYTGLPNVVVAELDIYYDATPSNSRLRAATYGRGLWESDLYTTVAPPVANFAANIVTPLVGQTVLFTDMSTNSPTSWSWLFNPPTVTFTGGTNANSQHPQVQFNNNGAYSVTLTSSNAIGSDGETKTDYIHAGTPGLWTGLISQDWNTSSNWHNLLVPTSSVDVTIPPSALNWPIYTGNFIAGTHCQDVTLDGASELTVTGDLTISSDRSITCNADGTLLVSGNWNNNATFNEGSSVVDFIGNGNSIINIPPGGPIYLIDDNINTWPGNWNGDIGTGYGQFDQWSSNNSGGISPEIRFAYLNSSVTATRTLYSNSINTTGLSSLTLDFNHMVDDWGGSAYTIKVQYSTNGSTWTDAGWTVFPTGDIAATTVSVPLTAAQGVGSPTYYISFVITGNLYNIDYWYIDDVKLYYNDIGVQTFYNLIDSKNNAEVISNGDIAILNDLSVKPGAYFTNATGIGINVTGNMILEGTSSGKASYIDNGTTIVGWSTIMESYYTDDRWHFVSSPVSSAMSNIFLDIYLKHWNEADSTWTYISATDSLLRVGQGYEIWPTIGNPTIQYTDGILNTGDISPTLTATDQGGTAGIGVGEGWNFVGNPYPSAINWGTDNSPVAGYVKTYLDNTIYCWNGTQYATYNPSGSSGNGLGTNGGSQYIQSLQSFFVKALNFNPVLTIPNGARIHSSQANLKSTTESQMIRLLVSGNAGSDEIVLEVNENSTTGFDSEFDAYKLWGYDNVPQFYFKTNEINLSVNVVPGIASNDVYNIGFRAGMENVFIIQATEIENFNGFEYILLEDLKTNTIVNLKENPVYEFAGLPIDNNNRFLLKFSDDFLGMESFNENMINVYAYQNTIYVQFLSEFNPGNLVVYDLLGQEVHSQKINNVENETISISAETGYYLVAFETNDIFISKKVFIK